MKIRAVFRVLSIIALMFVILFVSTGRWDYWQGWIYFLLLIYVDLFAWLIVPPDLLQERYRPGLGAKKWDKVIYYISVPLTYITPLIAALDGERYHWTGDFPIWVNASALVVIFLGYSLTIYSLWKNRFFSTIVRIQKDRGHYVIDKGPYAFVRHPGYIGLIISIFAIGFALNSLWALVPAGFFAIVFIIRTYLEDVTLQKELPGYTEYTTRVRYRLIPGVW